MNVAEDDRGDEIVVRGPYGRTLNRRTYRAMQTMARKILADLCDEENFADLWERYPEIGEDDWQEVLDIVIRLVRSLFPVDAEEVREAHAVLKARADHGEGSP